MVIGVRSEAHINQAVEGDGRCLHGRRRVHGMGDDGRQAGEGDGEADGNRTARRVLGHAGIPLGLYFHALGSGGWRCCPAVATSEWSTFYW
ncbi:hypothetical protein D9M71_805230 [compost metagenome]